MGDLLVRVSRPQALCVGGLTEDLASLSPAERKATCTFGPLADAEQPPVPCKICPDARTIECDVPAAVGNRFTQDQLQVRIVIGDVVKVALLSVGYPNVNVQVLEDECSARNCRRDGLQRRTLARITGRAQGNLPRSQQYALTCQCMAEAVGTMLLVLIGTGSVCSAVLSGFNAGSLWPIAMVWGFGVALAVAATASVSGAHLNPAVSFALALFRPDAFPWQHLVPYCMAQLAGAVAAGAFNLMIFGRQFRHFEMVHNIIRGSPESVITASAFGEYFPNPGYSDKIPSAVVTPAMALLTEAWATGILMFVILAVTDGRQKFIRSKETVPAYIGIAVTVLISLYAPLTQMGMNPARDFGPRVVAALAGWGRIAIPGPSNGFWIYIIGPLLGAPIGALAYDLLVSGGIKEE